MSGVEPSSLAWSPDGTALAFSMNGYIWRVDVGSGTTTQLTRDATPSNLIHDVRPAWSPDGSQIAFQRFERCFRCTGIYVMRQDGTVLHEILQSGWRPRWSPDGSRLAVSAAKDENGSFTSMAPLAIDLSGNAVVMGVGNDVSWSPRGTYLAYSSDGLRIVNVRDGARRRLSRHAGANPSWAPDGRVIAAGSGTRVALVRTRGGTVFKRFSDSTINAGIPSWSPEGVVFATHCGLRIANEAGTRIRSLTSTC